MKNYKQIFASILVAVSAFSATYLVCDFITPQVAETPQNIEQENTTQENYTVKSYKGKISVFKDNLAEPIYTLDSPYIRDLTQHDRNLLEEGINATSLEQLRQILEDFDN